MALDGVTLSYLVNELAPQLTGGRIDKIQQPEKDEVHFLIRSAGRSLRLLLNAGATAARIQLTRDGKKNPPSPPMFCMILRKHLEGGRIVALKQSGLERIVTLAVETYDEFGDQVVYHLILEIMGKHSNLILVDPQTNIILDGIKRYSHALSRHREVLPGRPYLLPPAQGKLEDVSDEEQWRETLFKAEGKDGGPAVPLSWERPVAKILLERFGGISPELAREIVIQAGLDHDIRLSGCGDIDLSRLHRAYVHLTVSRDLRAIAPCVYYDPAAGRPLPVAFSFAPFQQYAGLKTERLESLNDALVRFYESKAQNNALEALRGSLTKLVGEKAEHLRKKLALYEETLAGAESAMIYQRWGELLTANLYRLRPGEKAVKLEDYNEPDYPVVSIPLDPLRDGIANAQHYYRLYGKAKSTKQKTAPLKSAALSELSYLESLLLSLEQARTPAEIQDIRTEMVEQGYLTGKGLEKQRHGQKEKKKKAAENPQPRIFRSSQGRIIMVGKNNKQNDWLTVKQGAPQDLWLHVKNIPGSHVLIPLTPEEDFPDDQTLEEAAALAIHFSQARGSTLVPVDYTHVKNIRKPNGAKPGMVVYDTNWTLYLTPKQETLDKLLADEQIPEEKDL